MATLPVLGDLDLGNRQLLNSLLQLLGADGTAVEGKVIYRTDLDRVRVSDGSAWRSVAYLDELGSSYTDNQAKDAAGASATDSTEIDFTYNSGTHQLTAALIAGSIALGRLSNIAAHTYLGNNTAGAAAPIALTKAQLLTDLAIAPSDITGFDTQVRTNRLDQMAAPTASVSANSQKITNLLDGTAVTDAINLGQLQAAIEGRQWKDPVATSTTGALPNSPTYNSGAGTLTAGSNTTLAAQAGHTMAVGEDILVQNQASTFQNGIYRMTAAGSGAAPWVLTRRADASTAAELSNATTVVEASDSTLRGKIYTQQNTLADLTAAAQSYTITGDNNVYTGDGTTITLTGNQFAVTALGIGTAQLAANGVTNAKLAQMAQATFKMRASGAGTGDPIDGTVAQAKAALAYASTDLSDTAALTRKFASDVGNGSATDIAVTHSLGTKDIEVFVRRNSDDRLVLVPWVATSTTVVTLNFDVAPTSAQYRVVVQA